MNELRWSTTPPTEPGVYRWRHPGTASEGRLCEVYIGPHGNPNKLIVSIDPPRVDFMDPAYVAEASYEWSQRFEPVE